MPPLRCFALLIGAVSVVAAAESEPPQLTKLRFVPVAPCRVEDTRRLAPFILPVNGPAQLDLDIRGKCGIPPEAQAFSLNVTVVPMRPLGYLTVWPTGEPRPLVSLLNSWTGAVVAGATIVRGGIGGAVSLFYTDPTFLVVDVTGYFVDSPADLAFFPLKPCRVIDSRLIASFAPLFRGGQSRTVGMLSTCGVPASAQAYSLNFTAVADQPLGFLTAYPTGSPRPTVSTLNAGNGGVVANAAIVPAGNGGAIDVYVSDTTELVIDINGYFAPYTGDGALSLYIRPPCRVMDTRAGQGANGSVGPPSLAANQTRTVDLRTGRCYLPVPNITTKPELIAYLVNATVVPKSGLGYLTLWPFGIAQPTVSTLNSSLAAMAVSNMAIVQGGVSDKINVFASDQTDLILDLSGWFAP